VGQGGQYGIRDLLSEFLELFVHSRPPPSFLRLLLMLIIIPIPILPLAIPRLINRRIRHLPIKLHILGLPLPHHNRIPQMHMHKRHQLRIIRLKENMSDIIKQQIDPRVPPQRGLVAETVFVDLEFALDAFVVG
jgi:hypothetical protein